MPEGFTYNNTAVLFNTLGALVLILALAYVLLKWLGKRMPLQAGTKRIKLLDRVSISQDKCLVLVRVAEKTILVGMSSHTVEKICDIEDPEGLLDASEETQTDNIFSSLLMERMKSGVFSSKRRDRQ